MIIDEDDYMNFIEHHGVKGQKWGVRNIRERLEDHISPELEKLIKSTAPSLNAAQKKRIATSQAKHDAHFSGSVADGPKGWTPGEKHAAEVAAGVAFVGALTLATRGKDLSLLKKSFSEERYLAAARSADSPSWLKSYAGKEMSPADFKGIASDSTGRIWSGNYITKDLFAQKELRFEPGHQFFRVSHGVETSFHKSTFAVPSKEDAARYFLGWKGSTTNLVTFKAKQEVRIPDLHTTLEAVREHMTTVEGKKPKPEDVINQLNMFAGTDWTSPRAFGIVQSLKAKGYHGVIDYMDQGVYGETPTVLFDSSRFTPKVTTLRENVDVNDLTKSLVDINNRR